MAELPAAQQPVWRQVWREASSDRISLVAAGCAFYGLLALFPAMSLLISLYGLVFDPNTVEPQLELLRQLLPSTTHDLIEQRIKDLVSTQRPLLGWGAAISGGIALWSAASGTKSLISALNLAYGQAESRGFLAFNLIALVMTLCATFAVAIGIALMVFLPTALTLLRFPDEQNLSIHAASVAVMLLMVAVAISILYRFAPARTPPRGPWLTVGAVLATLLWAIASALFSIYVGSFANYDRTYGPLGAAVGLLMWLYISVYVVLLGAEVDAARQRLRRLAAGPGA